METIKYGLIDDCGEDGEFHFYPTMEWIKRYGYTHCEILENIFLFAKV